jgi:hypothetical protein
MLAGGLLYLSAQGEFMQEVTEQTMDEFLTKKAKEAHWNQSKKNAIGSIVGTAALMVIGNAISLPFGRIFTGAHIRKSKDTWEDYKAFYNRALYGHWESAEIRRYLQNRFDISNGENKLFFLIKAVRAPKEYYSGIRQHILGSADLA